MGALVNGEPVPAAQIRIPIAMVNRHGLVAGATGTGKTKTLQVLAEQLSAAGVPVFAADIKGDLSGIATAPGDADPKLLERTQSIGQDWKPSASPTEYYSLGGMGAGHPDPREREDLRAADAQQGARPQPDAGVEPRAGVPLRRQQGPRADHAAGPARGAELPGQATRARPSSPSSAGCRRRRSGSSCAS